MENQNICSICGEVISGDCYSAEPVIHNRICCKRCRDEVVKPRIKFFLDAVFK